MDAESLNLPEGTFNAVLCRWGMMFFPNLAESLRQIWRLLIPGGYFAAAVWDYGHGMEMLRYLWDEAADIDENAVAKHEGNMPLCRKGELASLWAECGLMTVSDAALTIQMDFASFDDYWAPFLTGVGPSGSYVSSLDAASQDKLKERLRKILLQGEDDAAFSLNAKAWAVLGTVKE